MLSFQGPEGPAPTIPARLCLRSGFTCFTRIADTLGASVAEDADPAGGIVLTYEEFVDAVDRLKQMTFPIEGEPQEAWPHFVGWRVNNEKGAYFLAREVSAPPALCPGRADTRLPRSRRTALQRCSRRRALRSDRPDFGS